ncbi:MAG: HD-GYP domain-containing protein [Treponema sp.]|nr:HD-GYP domain-containing protein [Treponema sp.]
MQSIPLDSLRENVLFTDDLMLDNNVLLLPKGCTFTQDLKDALKLWEFDRVLTAGGVIGQAAGQSGAPSSDADKSSSEGKVDFGQVDDEDVDRNKNKIGESVKKALESSRNSQLDGSDKSRMQMVQRVYDEYSNYIESVFTHYATHKEIDKEEIAETVEELCGFIKNNQRYILRINPIFENTGKNFLIIHTMRTTIIAITIAMYMRMPFSKIKELGTACILHEIGMLRLPPQIYITDKKLTPGERIQITKHTLFGYAILRDLEFPLNIQLGVLEHHERENGTGYPRKLSGEKISSIAKIIAVACSYEAITSSRGYKESSYNFDAYLQLLKNADHSYNPAIIKALFYTVSLYPIGSYVYLSNRKIGVVVDTNPDDPKSPVVQLVLEKDENGEPIICHTSKYSVYILRILNRKEKEDIFNILKKTEAPSSGQEEESQERASTKVTNEASGQAISPLTEEIDGELLEEITEEDNPALEIKTSVAYDSEGNPVTRPVSKPANTPSADEGMEDIDINMFS